MWGLLLGGDPGVSHRSYSEKWGTMLWPHPVLGRSSYELESREAGEATPRNPGESGPLHQEGRSSTGSRPSQLHLDLLKDLGSGSGFPAVQQQQVATPPGAPLFSVIWE